MFFYWAKVHDDFAIYLYPNTGLKVRDIFVFFESINDSWLL